MSALGRIGLFALGLLAIFAMAAGAGSLVEPADTESGGHGGTKHESGGHASERYSLDFDSIFFATGKPGELRFVVRAAGGEPITGFDELHERRLHLIVVRRDGRDFQHLHPKMDGGGTWVTPVELAEPGVYRAFADFSVGGERHAPAGDLFASGGEFEARPFPQPRAMAPAGDYEVRIDTGSAIAGEPSSLAFSVSRNGEPIDDLDPYLGAQGHLVALREGDLAFLHVHPEEGLSFGASFPTAGRYRLYLQFKHEGVVRTAAFTVEVPR